MPKTATQWTVEVSAQLDADLREFLTMEKGSATEAELATFIQDAVRARIFELTVRAAKAETANLDPAFVEEVIEEALTWARRQ